MAKRFVKDLLHKVLSYQIHGAAIEVRKDFGSGHKEKLYQKAFAEELKRRGIKFEREKAIKIYSPKDEKLIGLYRPDFIVEDKIVIEIKAKKFVSREEIKRIYDYLRNSKYELAYFVNFASSRFYVRRMIYTAKYKPVIGVKVAALLACIGLSLAFIGGLRAQAASQTIYFEGPAQIPLNSEFSVRILVDSDQPLNAYSLEWNFPPQTVELVSFNNGNSLISVWQKQPIVFKGGGVELNGGSITPFSGEGGELLMANFKAIKEGEAVFSLGNVAVFLANGKGTKVIPQTKILSFAVTPVVADLLPQDIAGQGLVVLEDTSPPDIKFLELIDDPFNSDQKLLSFSVADSGSGIKETLVRTRSFLLWSAWEEARNPTAVLSSVWSVEFGVLDNKGNVTERVLYDWGAFGWLALWVAIMVGAGGGLALIVRRRKTPSITNI